MGYMRVLWSRGCKIPYVYLTGYIRFKCGHPRGPCGFLTGMGTSVRTVFGELYGRADAVRAWDRWCRVLWGPVRPASAHLVYPVRPASAHSGYIYQTKQDYVMFDTLGQGRLLSGLLGQEIVDSPSLKVVHAQASVAGYTSHFKIFRNIRADSQCMPCDFPSVYTGLALTGPIESPRTSCYQGIKYLMLRSHA